jgi:flagellar motor switch protein FliG
MALSGREKATILLSMLGADASAKVLKYLPEDMADLLVSGVNDLPKPSPDVLSEIFSEFREFVAPSSAPVQRFAGESPGVRAAEKLGPREKISRASARVLVPALLTERPQTIAFVLTELPEPKVDEVLTYLPEQRREVEYLLNTLKMNPITEKIKGNILADVAKRLS